MKCIIGEHELTKEEIERIEHTMIKAWELIKQTVNDIVDFVWSRIKDAVSYLYNSPPVGCKKIFKQDELNYYESISIGKSNNWRHRKGLALIRRKPLA